MHKLSRKKLCNLHRIVNSFRGARARNGEAREFPLLRLVKEVLPTDVEGSVGSNSYDIPKPYEISYDEGFDFFL